MANVLKLYLETLPEPLLTHRLYDSVLAAATVRDEDGEDADANENRRQTLPRRSSRAIVALRSLLERLDAASRRTLRVTLAFASRVASADAATERRRGGRLGLVGDSAAEATRALAAALRVALLRPPRGWSESGEDIVAATRAVELLILHRDDVLRADDTATNTAADTAADAAAERARRSARRETAGAYAAPAVGVLSDRNSASEKVVGRVGAKDERFAKSSTTEFRGGANRDGDGKENRAEGDADASEEAPDEQLRRSPRSSSPRSSSPRSSSPFAERVPPTRGSRSARAEARAAYHEPSPVADVEEYETSSEGSDESAKARADESAMEAWMSACAGSLFAGDDVITAEFDRACGSKLDVLYVIPVHELSGPALAAEKHAIKRRLRSFDNGVEAYSGRKATKEDKRHLRPLYLRLAHVKRQMHVLETSGAGMGARMANAGGGQRR